METLTLTQYDIHIGHPPAQLARFLEARRYSQVAVLVDEHTRRHCLPLLAPVLPVPHFIVEIKAGETQKRLSTCEQVWNELLRHEMDRRGVLLCVGGGVIGDLGGFCAATYLRGIDFIQVPTTLLAMTDSSIGGKVGVDLSYVKNIIGAFRDPAAVFLFPAMLATLPREEVRSGFAELIKHALIADAASWQSLQDIYRLEDADWTALLPPSLAVKRKVVEADPLEMGWRQILNFGHTIGHAAETMALRASGAAGQPPIPLRHGEAVAVGMICEAWLSWKCNGMPHQDLVDITAFLQRFYSHHPLPAEQFPELLAIMRKDKKNRSGKIHFSLLRRIGDAGTDHICSEDDILESIRFYHSVYHPPLHAPRKRPETGQVPPMTSFLPGEGTSD